MREETQPIIRLNYGGEELLLGRDNTSIWQYAGRLASRSHIYFVNSNEESEIECFRMFTLAPSYPRLLSILTHNQFPQHMNLQTIDEADEEAYQKALLQLYEHQLGEEE